MIPTQLLRSKKIFSIFPSQLTCIFKKEYQMFKYTLECIHKRLFSLCTGIPTWFVFRWAMLQHSRWQPSASWWVGHLPQPNQIQHPSPLTGRQKPNQFAGQKQTVPVPVPVPALGQGSRVPGSGPGPRAGPSCGRVSLIGQLYQRWQERGRALQKLC